MIFLSNGSGEDAIASTVMEHLRHQSPSQTLIAFPMIGAGAAYHTMVQQENSPVSMVGIQPSLPSGGLTNENWRLWLSDLRNGFLVQKLQQFRSLRDLGASFPNKTLVCVGDLMPVIFARLAGFEQTVFVGTAKSSYHHPYSALEAWVLRRCCRQVFTRDELTAQDLSQRGVKAAWLGNPMMDDLTEAYSQMRQDSTRADEPNVGPALIAIFPGSRAATYEELPRLLAWFVEIARQVPAKARVAVAESIDLTRLLSSCSDWHLDSKLNHLELVHQPSQASASLFRSDMGGCLRGCRIAIGVAGTAHEQAAGLGVPVIAPHPTADPKALGWYRGRQQGLLGDALLVVRPTQIVESSLRLLSDRVDWKRRSQIGQARMGPPGGAAGIAKWLADFSDQQASVCNRGSATNLRSDIRGHSSPAEQHPP
jgi:uncharacterized protein (TIGR03492 family)